MTVIQTVTGVNEEASGVAAVLSSMCTALQTCGVMVELHSLALPRHVLAFPARDYPSSRWPHPSLKRSPQMFAGLRKVCRNADIVHINGLWEFPEIYPDWARRGTPCRLVISPHGTLAPGALRYSRLKKAVFGHLFQYRVLRHADLFVATAESEYADIRAFGLTQPVAVIPNGIDIPEAGDTPKAPRRRLFFLSRLHPKKNVELLLRCWAELEHAFPDWDLALVGPDRDNPYADDMKALSARLGCRRVTFEGELNGADKYRFMAASECLALPTHSENFGMVVAEALACGTPVICSHGAPWQGLESNGCGRWVAAEPAAFTAAMRDVMSRPRAELARMGARGRDWMRRDFSWAGIAEKLKAAYAWLLGKSEKSDFIRED